MLLTAKELFIVLCVTAPIFYFGRPLACSFMTEESFERRRKSWYVLTCAVFLSPNFWLFVLIAAVTLRSAAKKETNPAALFLFVLHASPPESSTVHMPGISSLFDLNVELLLSFCIMVPAARQQFKSARDLRYRKLRLSDLSLAAYGLLTSVLYVRLQNGFGGLYPVTFTDCLRRIFTFSFEYFIPYYVISRKTADKAALVEALAAFCFSSTLMAATSMFESVRHWLLYADISRIWGLTGPIAYVMRGDSLRAMASSGHPLALGYLLAIAFGFWLFLQDGVKSPRTRLYVSLVIWLGLIAAYSRGPWIGAVTIYFLFALLGPKAVGRVLKAAALFAGVIGVVLLSPLADRIIRVMPFMGGTVDNGNIIYRQRLFERSWQIILQSPVFGDQGALLKMQDMKQGEGIIDMINTYLQILLDNGFVGLSLFLSFILAATFSAFFTSRRLARTDANASRLGASLVACTIGTLIMIESGGCDKLMVCVLVGLMGAYVCQGTTVGPGTPARRPVE